MTDEEAQTQAQRNANLARIRDNQRRSRARRKEYLRELETRYRQCEQIGVEASAEIQAAARRVVEENKRLRQLLKQQGLTDAEIDNIAVDLPESASYPTSATSLEGMLGARKTCCPCDNSSSRTSAPDWKPGAVPATQSHSGPPPGYALHSNQPTPSAAQLGSSNSKFPSPLSSVSSGVPTPSNLQFPATSAPNFNLPTSAHHAAMNYHDLRYAKGYGWQAHNSHTQAATSAHYATYGATDVVRNVKPELGYGLDEDNGVPSSQIFSLMDGYPEGGGGV